MPRSNANSYRHIDPFDCASGSAWPGVYRRFHSSWVHSPRNGNCNRRYKPMIPNQNQYPGTCHSARLHAAHQQDDSGRPLTGAVRLIAMGLASPRRLTSRGSSRCPSDRVHVSARTNDGGRLQSSIRAWRPISDRHRLLCGNRPKGKCVGGTIPLSIQPTPAARRCRRDLGAGPARQQPQGARGSSRLSPTGRPNPTKSSPPAAHLCFTSLAPSQRIPPCASR